MGWRSNRTMPACFVMRTSGERLHRRERARRIADGRCSHGGRRFASGEPWSEGRLSGCVRETTPEGTVLKAAGNPRGMQGYSVGR